MTKQKIIILVVIGIFVFGGYCLDASTCRNANKCVKGEVKDGSQKVANVTVTAYLNGEAKGSDTTNSRGKYCITGLEAGNTYTLTCAGYDDLTVEIGTGKCKERNFTK